VVAELDALSSLAERRLGREEANRLEAGELKKEYDVPAEERRFVMLGHTEAGKALEQMDAAGQFDRATRDRLWAEASEQFARAAARCPAVIAFVKDADAARTFATREYPALAEHPNLILLTDEPVGPDSRFEQWPGYPRDAEGRPLLM
jgi:hypothetical protein